MSIIGNQIYTYFSNYSVTATTNFIYDSDGGTTSTSGWKRVVADEVVIQLCIATLTATSLTYRIEGRFNDTSRAAKIYTASVTAAHELDELIRITEKLQDVRVGVKISNSATPNIFYSSVCLTEYK